MGIAWGFGGCLVGVWGVVPNLGMAWGFGGGLVGVGWGFGGGT